MGSGSEGPFFFRSLARSLIHSFNHTHLPCMLGSGETETKDSVQRWGGRQGTEPHTCHT